MQIHISPRNIALTGAIYSFVAEKISHIEEHGEEILAAHIVLMHDERKTKTKQYVVKVHLAIPGPDIHAEDAENDLYSAIDKVVGKLLQQINKRKTKHKLLGRHRAQVAREGIKRGYKRR